MHIRHFILMGVFLGAAAFLPNNVFAEKNGAAGQPEPQNPAIHTPVVEKIKNLRVTVKAAPVAPKNVNKSQGGVVQKQVTNPSNQKAMPIKSAPQSPNKPNKSMEKVVPSIEKKVKASEPAEPVAKMKDTGQTGRVKTTAVTNKTPEVPKSLPSNQTNSEAETSGQPPSLEAKSATITENTEPSVSLKTDTTLTLVQKPVSDAENKTPSNHRKNLGDIEIMNIPPQRAQSSGGQSNEQFNPGVGTTIFPANLFDWDEYFGLNLGPIYTSRQAKFCHQWSNAPPSPPPKAAPFFLTFTTYNDN
ncbi:hypothetical protein [Neobacillus vireti]|uniref:hypothetical protein n=1 Tax=Neobacillus vireti TaxID=220686 RepID=UPI002FFFD131